MESTNGQMRKETRQRSKSGGSDREQKLSGSKSQLSEQKKDSQRLRNMNVESDFSSDSESEMSDFDSVTSSSDSAVSSQSESDDVTDVSPLSSPCVSPESSPVANRRAIKGKNNFRVRINQSQGTTSAASFEKQNENSSIHSTSSKNIGVAHCANKPAKAPSESSVSDSGFHQSRTNGTSDTMHMKLLMKAVLEMEKDQQTLRSTSRQSCANSVASAASSRASQRSIASSTRSTASSRKNHSFSNEQVRNIDRENQRLLRAIQQKPRQMPASNKLQPQRTMHVSSSAINRFKEQRKIEQENLALLRRLENVKPSKNLMRKEHDKHFASHLYHRERRHPDGRQLAGPTSGSLSSQMPQRASSSALPLKSSSLMSLGSAGSSRRSSAASRPHSAITKREWTNRW